MLLMIVCAPLTGTHIKYLSFTNKDEGFNNWPESRVDHVKMIGLMLKLPSCHGPGWRDSTALLQFLCSIVIMALMGGILSFMWYEAIFLFWQC
ncbi:hypothetical protein [Neorickettsia sp. 179522]|uniref:hypothetical protein n=1 Tax=Neorickettsia sp. 179522 TaxID=1714371 RepID=UPI000791C428|nr:hypothetical protein [Neorickettsia sp. 179522]KYH12227.1 hypothetical protein AS219_00085 [Neorickettsia sp. 179522]